MSWVGVLVRGRGTRDEEAFALGHEFGHWDGPFLFGDIN